MRIPLRCWDFHWLWVEFDVNDGRVTLHLHPREICGWTHRADGQWYGVWNDDGRLCFQFGSQRWYANDGWKMTVETSGRHRVFTLADGSHVGIVRRYRDPSRAWWRALDVGRNQDDEAFADFFKWASELWSDKEMQTELFERAWKTPRSLLKSVSADSDSS
jgi:hypothetical protein